MYYIIEIGKDYNARRKWASKNFTLNEAIFMLDEILVGRDYYDFYMCKYSVSDYLHDYCKSLSKLQLEMLLSFDEFWEVLN